MTIQLSFPKLELDVGSNLLMLPAFGIWPMYEFELDILAQHLDNGVSVTLLICRGDASMCNANPHLKKRICSECQSRVQSGVKWLKKYNNFHVEDYYSITFKQQEKIDDIYSKQSLIVDENDYSHWDIDGVDINAGAYSTLQTMMKQFKPDVFSSKNLYIQLLEEGVRSYFSFKNHYSSISPDCVYIYNGRMIKYRTPFRFCKKENISVATYEYPLHGYRRPLIFPNNYIHDLGYRSKIWKENFDKCQLGQDKKIKLGENWMSKRLKKVQMGWEPSYAADNEDVKLPEEWNRRKYNILVLNSSEWEVSGVPEAKRWIYGDQLTALESIFIDTQNLKNIHFTIRVHPHLSAKDSKSAELLMKMERFSNVTVIPPQANNDTHALIKESDLILSFYSMAGAEAAYLGKRVICIGPCAYQEFDCVCLPRTHEEVLRVIKNSINSDSDFPSKKNRKTGAAAYAFSRMFSGTKSKYLRKNEYYSAYMSRDGIDTVIQAELKLQIINRILDIPNKIALAFIRIKNNKQIRKRIYKSPYQSISKFIKNNLFGKLP